MPGTSEKNNCDHSSLPTARLKPRGVYARLFGLTSDLRTWSVRRAVAIGRTVSRCAPAVFTAVFIGAVSVGMSMILDKRGASSFQTRWQLPEPGCDLSPLRTEAQTRMIRRYVETLRGQAMSPETRSSKIVSSSNAKGSSTDNETVWVEGLSDRSWDSYGQSHSERTHPVELE